jgi:hypothetical protein
MTTLEPSSSSITLWRRPAPVDASTPVKILEVTSESFGRVLMALPVALRPAETGSMNSPTSAATDAPLARAPASLPFAATARGPAPRVRTLKTTVAEARAGFSSHLSQATRLLANSLAAF